MDRPKMKQVIICPLIEYRNIFLKEFVKDECRCRCTNAAEKEACERQSGIRNWDPILCRCFCPPSTFAICEENQVYDFRKECRLVSFCTGSFVMLCQTLEA